MMLTFQSPLCIYARPVLLSKSTCFESNTDATCSLVLVKISVLRRVFMALRAMSLEKLIFAGVPASSVVSVKNSFKMLWVATKRVAAQMVDLFTFWNGTDEHLVCEAMNLLNFPADTHMPIFCSVALGTCATHPYPAMGFRINVNIGANAIRQLRRMHSAFEPNLEGVANYIVTYR